MNRIIVKILDLVSKFDVEIISSGLLHDGSANRQVRMKLTRSVAVDRGFITVIGWRLSADGTSALFDEYDKWSTEVAVHIRKLLIERRVSFNEVELSPTNEESPKRANGTVYITNGPDNSVSISAYPMEHREYEVNHIDVLDQFNPKQSLQTNTREFLANIFRQAGINVVQEH